MKLKKLLLVGLVLTSLLFAACEPRLKFTCRDGVVYLNGEEFDCSVCYRALGCTLEGSTWHCPPGVELSCSFNDETGEVCCGGKCYSCNGEIPPEPCPGYTGTDTDCCQSGDPCGLARNGSCDCDDTCSWDNRDCHGIKVDMLVVVDNSGSMEAEQAMLHDAFPNLITALLDPPIDPGTGQRIHAPVRDLHLGVVSTDMGVGGYIIMTCENSMIGDDGVLQHEPHGADCDASYPTFLSYAVNPTDDPDTAQVAKLATDFGCIAVLGTRGCGFEQQLEAAHKALLLHSQPGGTNQGFLRPDSILAILFVTDEEDCSADDLSIFDITALPYSINLQCYYQQDKLHGIDRYATSLQSLRPNPDDLVLGFIVGVPPGEPACEGSGDNISGCLDIPAMQEIVRPDGNALEYACLFPSTCTPPDPPIPGDCTSEAFPGRRFVQLAQAIGENAVVQSICTDSFVPAIDALTEKLRDVIKN